MGKTITTSENQNNVAVEASLTQEAKESELLTISKQKWQWMANKDVEKLNKLFDEKSRFVHMGGTWGKQRELDVIESGGIHYKKADIHEVSVQVIDGTAIVLNRITLLAVVGGREVTNNFMVTEVYINKQQNWSLGVLSFTKLID
ncbi:nuclear transport factor 2 family protein [Salinimonas sediminis]|uniref:Nuclear transport factor 2 family protein n=2 Tax=Salinimonas sediminis TaxID=2303538 RepID=A0A346NSP6_9ALTE|nr:nuclear transport factor 2 family protein [Salinimonas sediminis]